MSERVCVCESDDPRDCYTLRYYGVAGLGAPSREQDADECGCACHAEYDEEEDEWPE